MLKKKRLPPGISSWRESQNLSRYYPQATHQGRPRLGGDGVLQRRAYLPSRHRQHIQQKISVRLHCPLCATLRIACNEPYTIEVEGKTLQTRASLVAPRAGRKRVTAVNSDIALFYIPIDMPEYAALKKKLGKQKIIDLPFGDVEAFVPTIRKAMIETLSPEAIKGLVKDVVRAITGETDEISAPMDSRVVRAREILDDTPLNEVRLESLAEQVHLSPSRLRELFKKQTGFTIGQYARWRAVWRASLLWQRGLKFTDLALEAGFHDLAHVDRAFNEVFGMNPSKVIDPVFVTLVNCEATPDEADKNSRSR